MGLIINSTKMGMPYINSIKYNAYIGGSKIWNSLPPPPPPPPLVTNEFAFLVKDIGSFGVPVSGVNEGTTTYQTYNWKIDWGDGSTQTASGTGNYNTTITHNYTDGKGYHNVIIKPNGTATQGWFNAFGSSEYQTVSNIKKIIKIYSPITSIMRTMNAYSHYSMFRRCTGLISIPSNLLPATTIANHCYESMFRGCTGLTSLPANLLPSTTIANYCYGSMFSGCTGLTSLPANLLPVMNLATNCYYNMFRGCTGLTSLPDNLLPATTLQNNCYSNMFYDCTGLTNIGTINADWFTGKTAQSYMFMNDTAITTPITYANIPTGWK
jgi:hypothetical protein